MSFSPDRTTDIMKQAHHNGTLHLLNKVPGHPRFVTCLTTLSDQDRLVLIENAVLALSDTDTTLPPHTVALETDLEARGLSDTVASEQRISHSQLVQLTEHYSRIISW
ncbi:MAG: sulfurtransferase complex subunit TusB [Marinobacter sp.]